jgi:hypothetical protein
MSLTKTLNDWQSRKPALFVIYAIIASFVTYSCMYAFRKPFAAATFDEMSFFGVDYKILLIVAQVIGYMLSKFAGIKVVSEMGSGKRIIAIVVLIGIAAISLLFFGLVPAPYNIFFMFLNGIPLGMVWGLVFSFLEGRRYTEVLGAGLSVSFIFSSGFVKTVAMLFLQSGVSEFWMPLFSGLVFVPVLLIAVYLLGKVPPPDERDISQRTKREPMNASQRWQFFRDFAPGLTILIAAYAMLTAFRDFRDNFAAEIWRAVGYGGSAEIFTLTEIPVSLAVLVIMGALFIIKDNFRALIVSHVIIGGGIALTGISTFLFQSGVISAPLWMILVGAGLYFGYVPYNSMFFDRLIAAFKRVSNVGFLIYLADSFGYLGSVGVMFFKNFGRAELSWLDFFINSCYLMSIAGTVLLIASIVYFSVKYKMYAGVAKEVAIVTSFGDK